ncbi:MAG: single-strand DNA-binding protein [bacterium]|nr:MAG: single-strand DNA-binding protein [bacterium]
MVIMGKVGRDPQVKLSENGYPICYLAVATSETIKEQKLTTWYQVILWGYQAEQAEKILTKGSNVYIEGCLHLQEMKDKEGKLHNVLEISCKDFRCLDLYLGSKPESYSEPQPETKPKSRSKPDEDFGF